MNIFVVNVMLNILGSIWLTTWEQRFALILVSLHLLNRTFLLKGIIKLNKLNNTVVYNSRYLHILLKSFVFLAAIFLVTCPLEV